MMETANPLSMECAVVDVGELSEGRFPISTSTLSFGYGDGKRPSTSVSKALYHVSRIRIWGESSSGW